MRSITRVTPGCLPTTSEALATYLRRLVSDCSARNVFRLRIKQGALGLSQPQEIGDDIVETLA